MIHKVLVLILFTCPPPSPSLSRAHRLGPSDDEMYQRTTVSVMQKEPGGGAMILSYSSQGFNIDGNRVFGPCALLPPAILQWNVRSIPRLPLHLLIYTITYCFVLNSFFFSSSVFCLYLHFFLRCFKSLSLRRLAVIKTSQKKVSHCFTCLNHE